MSISRSPKKLNLKKYSKTLLTSLTIVTSPLLAKAALPGKGPISTLSIATTAPKMILFDYDTGAVLAEVNGNEKIHPASITKIMTTHLVMEKLHNKDVTEDTKLPISEKAWKIGGSTMFLQVHTEAPVIDLLHGAIVVSGNDACIALAEGLWGDETFMVQAIMNKIKSWGLKDTNFTNVTGWPDPNHYTTARDLAVMGVHVFEDYPEYYHIYSLKEYEWDGHKQGNRNPLLYKNIGCDGIKTGHTENSGHSLLATCKRGDRRLFLVIIGLPSMQNRSDESVKLINWGFQVFENEVVLKAGEVLKTIEVKGSDLLQANVGIEKDVKVTLPRFEMGAKQITYDTPNEITAPFKKGDVVGTVSIKTASLSEPHTFPLILMHDVPQASLWNSIKQTVSGWIKSINPF